MCVCVCVCAVRYFCTGRFFDLALALFFVVVVFSGWNNISAGLRLLYGTLPAWCLESKRMFSASASLQ